MRYAISLLLFATPFAGLWAETKEILVSVEGPKAALKNVLIRVPLRGIDQFHSASALYGGQKIPAQLAETGGSEAPFREVSCLLPELAGGSASELKITLDTKIDASGFKWIDAEGSHPILMKDNKKVLEYVRPKFDPKATPPKQQAIANPTIKVYHHLYDLNGETRLTNGAEGQYPHHRGIFFGFNRISYSGKTADIWHCRNGESQQHEKVLRSESGPLFGSQTLAINWNGQDGATFAKEVRDLSVFSLGKGWLIDFSSRLSTDRDKVRLDGDPQHAGFHYRAAVEVEKNKDETYFASPAGVGQKGKEINWEPKTKLAPTINRDWTTMSFVIGGKRYTCLYLDHPSNPKEARQSERTYGRVGTYFEYDLTPNNPLNVKYRLWVVEGELTPEQCIAMSQSFTEKVKVTVK